MNRFAILILVPLFVYTAGIIPAITTRSVDSVASANELYEQAHLAFERGETETALRLYQRIAQSDFATPAVWFNAGTAAYREGDVGRAVLYYRKALRLDPGFERARSSLDVVSPATNRSEENFGQLFVDALFAQTSPTLWVVLAQAFVLAVWFSLARLMAARTADQRGHWFSILAWCMAFAVVCGGIGYANHRYRLGGDEAVVVKDAAIGRSEPRSSSSAVLELPAGTLLELTEKPRNGFVRFETKKGKTGYIQTQDIEKI